jgi:uncharacterized protein
MRWTPGGTSSDIEDHRDDSGGGGFGGLHLGIGGVLVVGLLSLLFHRNLFTLFSGYTSAPTAQRPADPARTQREQPEVEFVSFVLDDVQKTWAQMLPAAGGIQYRRAKLVLFRDSFPSACGRAERAIGPFYCPGDQKVYLDLGFFDELKQRFGAPGEFAQAYVIAHEIGHHVQDLVGIERHIRRLQEAHPQARNQLSIRLELQADCLPASGEGPLKNGIYWTKTTSIPGCRLQPQWVTTGSSGCHVDMSLRNHLLMAHRSNECTGSVKAWTRVTCRHARR